MRGRLYGGLAIGVVSLVIAFLWYQETNKQARLDWLARAERAGDQQLTVQLLGNLVRDYPDDPVLEDHWKTQQAEVRGRLLAEAALRDEVAQHGRILADLQKKLGLSERNQRSLQARTETVQNNLRSFQSEFQTQFGSLQDNFGTLRSGFDEFSVQLDQSLAAVVAQDEPQPEQDYLYLLLRESRDARPLGATETKGLVNQALVAVTQRQWTQAKGLARQVLRSDPKNAQAASLWIYASVREAPESLDHLGTLLPVTESLLDEQPSNYWALVSAGALYRGTGNWSLALERYRRATEADPTREAKEGWMASLLGQGQTTEAQGLAWDLWDSGPQDDDAALAVWGALKVASEDQRRRFFGQWRSAHPDSALVDVYEGDLEAQAGRLDAAIERYQASYKKKATKATLQRLAEVRLRAGLLREAAGDLRSLLRWTNPGLEAGRAEFASVGRALVQADAQAQAWSDVIADGTDVLRVVGEAADVRALVGRAYLTVGDPGKAAEVLEPLPVDGGQVGPLDDLLKAYWALRKYDLLKKRVEAVGALGGTAEVKARLAEWKTQLATLEKKQ